MFLYIHKTKTIYIFFLFSLLSFFATAEPSYVQYRVIKGDTLWSLSNTYLRDPFLWPRIKREDGLNVGEPKLLQIGTLLVIGNEIASEKALKSLPVFTVEENNADKIIADNKVLEKPVSVPKKTAKQNSPYHFYLVKDGLVYAYYKGQHVTVPVEYLKPKAVDVKSLGTNVHIDKALLNSIFKKDI